MGGSGLWWGAELAMNPTATNSLAMNPTTTNPVNERKSSGLLLSRCTLAHHNVLREGGVLRSG
eukprot:2247668-Pyramimonas_sp.AAC.1